MRGANSRKGKENLGIRDMSSRKLHSQKCEDEKSKGTRARRNESKEGRLTIFLIYYHGTHVLDTGKRESLK